MPSTPISATSRDWPPNAAPRAATALPRKMAIHPGAGAGHQRGLHALRAKRSFGRGRSSTAFAKNPGAGVVGVDGEMLDRPHLSRAERLLGRAERSPPAIAQVSGRGGAVRRASAPSRPDWRDGRGARHCRSTSRRASAHVACSCAGSAFRPAPNLLPSPPPGRGLDLSQAGRGRAERQGGSGGRERKRAGGERRRGERREQLMAWSPTPRLGRTHATGIAFAGSGAPARAGLSARRTVHRELRSRASRRNTRGSRPARSGASRRCRRGRPR